MEAFVLTACQRKGGVGRSTLLYNLAGALSVRGKKVLLVDLDPQASISQIILGPETVDVTPPARTIVALMDENYAGSPMDLVQPTGMPHIDLLPGSNAMARFN